ncbi:MAG TPA: hypothetical protein HA367_08230 [Candidatus Methanofastidiosum sp.]|jgi:hypothetical protein|nr:hypothetical protein [Methanofastidiosum sp.]
MSCPECQDRSFDKDKGSVSFYIKNFNTGYSDLEVVKEKKDLSYFLISPIIIIFYRPLYAFVRFKGYLDFIFRRDPVWR